MRKQARRGLTAAAVSTLCVSGGTANANLLGGGVVNGDFELGNVGFATDYTLDPDVLDQARYTVASTVPNGWADGFGDHTTGSGLMAIFNASTDPNDRLWAQNVVLAAGSTYTFDGWVAALTESIRPGTAPRIELRVDGVSQGVFDAALVDDTWQPFAFQWTASADGLAELSLHDLRAVFSGDDFALDDLALVPEPATGLLVAGALVVLAARFRRR